MAALINKGDSKWIVRALVDDKMEEYEYTDEVMARKKLDELNMKQARGVLEKVLALAPN